MEGVVAGIRIVTAAGLVGSGTPSLLLRETFALVVTCPCARRAPRPCLLPPFELGADRPTRDPVGFAVMLHRKQPQPADLPVEAVRAQKKRDRNDSGDDTHDDDHGSECVHWFCL